MKIELSSEEQEKAKSNVEKFLNEFMSKVQKDAKYSIENSKTGLNVNIENNGILLHKE